MAKAENKDTPESTLYAIEDVWIKAFARLPDDAKPLADLLRAYSTPISDGARDQLAELLSPGDPDMYGGRLVYEPTKTFRRLVGDKHDDGLLARVAAYYDYYARLKWAGAKGPHQEAAETIGEASGRDARTIRREVRAWRNLVARLRGQ